MDIPKELIAITAALVEKLGKQLYINPTLGIRPEDSRAFNIHWYERSINSDVQVWGESTQEVIEKAWHHIRQMPDAETSALIEFQKNLAKVIDNAPAALNTSILSEFNAQVFENLLTHEVAT